MERLTPNEVHALMNVCGTTPIGIRHTHAAELHSEGIDIGIISKSHIRRGGQLGHRSVATIARYQDHIAPFALADAIGARKW